MKVIAPASVVALALSGAAARPASAQPLQTFLDAARRTSPDVLESKAIGQQRRDEATAARWKLYPSVGATLSYTRNQYDRSISLPGGPTLDVLVLDQFDAGLSISVPIVDLGARARARVAATAIDAASASEAATGFELDRRVTRAYYQHVASVAVLDSARRSLQLSQSNVALVQDRRNSGLATELDVQRATADVARATQDVASAELTVTNNARQLFSLTGIQPETPASFPADDLHPEAPLPDWLPRAKQVPTVTAIRAQRVVAEQSADAARKSWYPTLNGVAQERFTNATGFVGHEAYYTLSLQLTWRFDGSLIHSARAQDDAANAARAREARVERDAEDAIYNAWQQVETGIKRARAARDQATAAQKTADLARQQYGEGLTTQLELLAAQQEAFRAEVGRIQADADLGYTRAALRLFAAKEQP